MKKKEVEVDVKAAKLEKQLEANIRLHKLLMETEDHIAPARKYEICYDSFIEDFHFKIDPTLHSYPCYFDKFCNLKAYYDKISHEAHRDKPLLSYRMNVQLEEWMIWMDEIIKLIEAFGETEAAPQWHYTKQTQEANTDLAVRLLGIALQHDTKVFMDDLRNTFSYKLHHPKLSTWKDLTIKDRANKYLSEKIEQKLNKSGKEKGILHWFYYNILHPNYGRSQIHRKKTTGDIIVLLAFVHYSPKYLPNDIYESKENGLNLIKAFYESFIKVYKQWQR